MSVPLAAAPLAPQGGLRWIDPSQRPTLHVREHANHDWTLCFSGWSTTGGVALGGNDQAAAVGTSVSVHTVRSVTCDVVQGGEGGVVTAMPLFPFADDPAVDPIFSSRGPINFNWTGFRAATSGPVADHNFGALSFRMPMTAPYTALALLPLLDDANVGACQLDALGRPVGQVVLRTPSNVQLAAICYYKFDRGRGNGALSGSFAVNYAGVEGGAAGIATLQRSAGGSPWTSGVSGGASSGAFDSALAAGASCDTGFFGDLGGRFSVAWFMRGPNTNAESTVFSMSGWRCFTGGRAGRGLVCEGWSLAPIDLDLPADIQTLAGNGYVHIALVVDSDRGQAVWFVNGVNRRVISVSPSVRLAASQEPLRVGSAPGRPCTYDIDEFHLRAEAMTSATVANLASGSPAVGQAFSRACGANLQANRTPSLGVEVVYRLEAAPGATAALFLGLPPAPTSLPLPIDLSFLDAGLAGCLWYCDMTASLGALTVPSNPPVALFRLRIPNDMNLRGLELYNQALVAEPGPLTLHASNAHVLSID